MRLRTAVQLYRTVALDAEQKRDYGADWFEDALISDHPTYGDTLVWTGENGEKASLGLDVPTWREGDGGRISVRVTCVGDPLTYMDSYTTDMKEQSISLFGALQGYTVKARYHYLKKMPSLPIGATVRLYDKTGEHAGGLDAEAVLPRAWGTKPPYIANNVLGISFIYVKPPFERQGFALHLYRVALDWLEQYGVVALVSFREGRIPASDRLHKNHPHRGSHHHFVTRKDLA